MFGIKLYAGGISEAGRTGGDREEPVKIECWKRDLGARLYSILLVPGHSGIYPSDMSVHESDLGN